MNTCTLPSTLYDSKLHHHGNHYQEKWVIKECMEEGEDRSAKLQQDRQSEKETEGGGRETEKSSCPKGRNAESTLHSNSVDLI